MNKRDRHRQELSPYLDAFLGTDDSDPLNGYLSANSNLPGRRGNLELAQAFGDAVFDYAGQGTDRLWSLCSEMTALSADRAPVNDPLEFIPFCGAVGMGALGAADSEHLGPALDALYALANDSRWRMREAVCSGLQQLIGANPPRVVPVLEGWIEGASWLELRAIAAGMADPGLLQDSGLAHTALRMHQQILLRVQQAEDRRSETFRTMRKGLGYTLSVVVAAIPGPGFAWLADLVRTGDRDVLWIVRQNLRKNRLVRPFPAQVAALTDVMEGR